MSKKLSSLEDLAKIQFENLAPDPEGYVAPEDQFIPQQLEAHFSNKGRAGKTVTVIKGFEGAASEDARASALAIRRTWPARVASWN